MVKHSLALCLFLAWKAHQLFSVQALSTRSSYAQSSPRVVFSSLDEASFRHPLDRDLTSLVQSFPGGGVAEQALRGTFPLLEQGVRLDLLSTAVKASPQQFPELYELMQDACRTLGFSNNGSNNATTVPLVELYVQSNPQANAYTLAFQSQKNQKRGKEQQQQQQQPPIVVITSALLDRCTDAEIQAILGHELGHLKCEHSIYLTLGSLASTPLRTMLPFLGRNIDQLLQEWRLAAEYTCDRASLLVAQDPKVVAGALLKLFAGTSKYSLNTDAFVAQCLEYDRQLEQAHPLVRRSIQAQQRTHPLPVRRVAELERWAQSEEYRQLVSSQRDSDELATKRKKHQRETKAIDGEADTK